MATVGSEPREASFNHVVLRTTHSVSRASVTAIFQMKKVSLKERK